MQNASKTMTNWTQNNRTPLTKELMQRRNYDDSGSQAVEKDSSLLLSYQKHSSNLKFGNRAPILEPDSSSKSKPGNIYLNSRHFDDTKYRQELRIPDRLSVTTNDFSM